MTNVTDDNLGRRLFQVQKEKAVEDALEKMRRESGIDWHAVPASDNDILKDTLGELWTSIERTRWGSYSFSKLSKEDIVSLITRGRYIKSKHIITDADIKSLDAILSRTI